jgi:hypothetical protein
LPKKKSPEDDIKECNNNDIKLGTAFDLAEAFKSRRGQAGNETMDPGGGILALEDNHFS